VLQFGICSLSELGEINIIYAAAVLDIVVSSFIVVITFFGCLGAMKVGKMLKSSVVSNPFSNT
jgi:hypothetical protein